MSESDAKAVTDPEMRVRRKAARAIGYALWRHDWRKDHPEAGRDEMDAAWEAAKAEEMKKARRALSALEREGFDVVEARRWG